MKYIVAIDIGGTTFNTGIFSESLNQIDISKKDKIRYYDGKTETVDAIIHQVNTIIDSNNINKNNIIGVGIASPGPLDSKKEKYLIRLILKFFKTIKLQVTLQKD